MSESQRVTAIDSIRFDSLNFSHDGHDPTLTNADFDFPTNKVIWIQSHEGAGKSTVLQILAGLLVPQSGKYILNNDNVTDMSFEDFLTYRLGIGYTFDYGGLINNRTIEENLLLPLTYHNLISRGEAKQRVENILRRFDLMKFKDERPAHVPGRVRKLGCLLRALVIHPEMLLMDDPSVGLGSDTTGVFVDVIHDLRKQGHLKHIFVTSYDDKFMGLMDYDCIYLDQGQLYLEAEDATKKVVNT
jgi:phospholipid/cholesterol/gamma-HCH transport system ATP-binding protein